MTLRERRRRPSFLTPRLTIIWTGGSKNGDGGGDGDGDGDRGGVGTAWSHGQRAGLLRLVIAGIVVLNLANLGVVAIKGFQPGGRLYRWFALASEDGIANWGSGALLLFAAALCAMTARHARDEGSRWTRHWIGLAVVFTGLAVDELGGLHERFGSFLHDHADLPTALAAAGVIPGVLTAVAVVVLYLRFLDHLPRSTAILMIAGGVIYVTGAAGFELLAGWLDEIGSLTHRERWVLETVEENFELIGVTLFVAAVLRHLTRPRREPAHDRA